MYELRPPAPRTAVIYTRIRAYETRPRPYTLFAPPSMHRATRSTDCRSLPHAPGYSRTHSCGLVASFRPWTVCRGAATPRPTCR
jgi:hypothetical protein